MSDTRKKTGSEVRESEKKWGKPAIDAGFSIVPNMLLHKQHALGIDCIDVVILLQIAKHWWRADQSPYPSQVQLAETMDVNLSTIKRHLNNLRRLGFISWDARKRDDGGQTSNIYSLTGLVTHLNRYAEEELAARATVKEERKERHARKRARSSTPVAVS
ncbi:MAG: helix-turn-helix domain-containing protein [Myxococcaceae bacterium]|nr:MAG: helix-turn-helix domain-containing protein [Myxococcaceae bacterium]